MLWFVGGGCVYVREGRGEGSEGGKGVDACMHFLINRQVLRKHILHIINAHAHRQLVALKSRSHSHHAHTHTLSHTHTYRHTYTHIYIFIYIINQKM
jgi:hypothetical protein